MDHHTPVFAAIPNYNMGQQLKRLLPTLINRGYAHIYVLDDNSTDDSSKVAAKFIDSGVTFITSESNVGAGATRNRILDYQTKGIVHFLDADMKLLGRDNVADNIRAAFRQHPEAGCIGFRVLNPDKSQYDWNFGPIRQLKDGVVWLSYNIYSHSRSQILHSTLQKLFQVEWQKWWTYMHINDADIEHKVGVVAECNMAVRLEDFAKVQGFDRDLRFHEIHSLALKLKSIGKIIWYVPEVPSIIYDEIDVRPKRKREIRRASRTLVIKRLTGQYSKF